MRSRDLDLYEVLGLEHGATWEEVRTAYRRLAKKHHPDKNPGDNASEWIFKQVGEAYERLKIIHRTQSWQGEDRKRRGRQGHERHEPEPPQNARKTRREREQRDEARAHAGRDQEKSQRPPPRTPNSGSGVAEGSDRKRKARRSLVAVPAGLVVVAVALVATEGIRDRMNDAEPAVVDDRGPSPAPRQSTQHDEPLGVTRARRELEARGFSPLEIEERIQRAYREVAREQATGANRASWGAEPVSGELGARDEELTSQPATEEIHFEMPPPGTDLILSLPQLRWCLREDRLIELYRPNVVDEWDQDAFNRVVDRYDDRCGSFRYRQGDLERARREVGGR